jgi:hypothetical protein
MQDAAMIDPTSAGCHAFPADPSLYPSALTVQERRKHARPLHPSTDDFSDAIHL